MCNISCFSPAAPKGNAESTSNRQVSLGFNLRDLLACSQAVNTQGSAALGSAPKGTSRGQQSAG